jgi:hypothetical protein
MELSCEIMDIAQAAAGCEEQFSGLGNTVYVALPEDLTAPPEYEESGKAAYSTSAFTFDAEKGAYKIRCKKQTVQITATANEGAKGYNVQMMFTVDKDVMNAAQVFRVLKNRGDVIFFAENPAGGYYVVYDPHFGTEIVNNYDTGTTPDSDMGHTVTVTCNPCPFALTSWDGTLTIKSELGVGG